MRKFQTWYYFKKNTKNNTRHIIQLCLILTSPINAMFRLNIKIKGPSKNTTNNRAIEKIKEASIKKIFIKVFGEDGSAKSLLVDERMTVAQVCRMLAEKKISPFLVSRLTMTF